jgi:GNAT superfamily N-acetyltransferase
VSIREFEDSDAPGAAVLLRQLLPAFTTARRIVHRAHARPERAQHRQWVVEERGEIVGWCVAQLDWTSVATGAASVWAVVRPDRRRRGLGTALWDAGEHHVRSHGAHELVTYVSDPDGERFVVGRGFERARESSISSLDPTTVDTASLAELERTLDVDVVPLGDVLDRPREVYELFAAVLADVPADRAATDLRYEEFVRRNLDDPDLSREGSYVVLDGTRPVALAFLLVDQEGRRAQNELTGTLRAYRRRGLARLAKLAAIRWCADHGIERIVTGNDATNTPMLALNRALGYRPLSAWWEYVRRDP